MTARGHISDRLVPLNPLLPRFRNNLFDIPYSPTPEVVVPGRFLSVAPISMWEPFGTQSRAEWGVMLRWSPRSQVRSLRGVTPRARVGAIAAALPVAGDEEFDVLADELLDLTSQRLDIPALVALAGCWTRLSASARERLKGMSNGWWGEIAALLAEHRYPPFRASLAGLAADVPDLAVADRLAPLLRDEDEGVRAAAGAALIDLAGRAAEEGTRGWGGPAEAAVARAADEYERTRSVAAVIALLRLLARPAMPAPGGPLRAIAEDESHPIHGAARQMIRRSPRTVSVADAWRLMRYPALTPACLARIQREGGLESSERWRGLLGLGHLVAHPCRAAGLRRLAGRSGGAAVFDPIAAAAAGADCREAERAAAPTLLDAAGIRPAELDRLVLPLLTDRSASVRYSMVRAGAARRPMVLSFVLDLCFDADVRCARSAVLVAAPWRRIGRTPEPTLDAVARGLRRSPHAPVRRLGREVRIDGDDLFLGDARSRLAARDLLRRDWGRLLAEVRKRLTSGDEAASVAAARLAVDLGIVAEVEIELLSVLQASGHQGRRAATAAAALGHLSTSSSHDALLALLGAPDARVRANALDALVRRARWAGADDATRSRIGSLAAEFRAEREHHRVRAGALRGGFLIGTAAGGAGAADIAGLGAMLADDRPMHRIAGLWLAERVAPEGPRDGWGEIARRVSALGCDDPEPAVRVRAERCAAALMVRFRSDWASRAAVRLEVEHPAEMSS